ncbi:hypothetical protein ABL78_8440, partial [Leptomonas seymouri]
MWAKRNVVVAVVAVVALLCSGEVRSYDFVPIISVFHVGASSGTSSGDASICLSRGGYLATEATAVLHNADVAAIQNAIGAATEFYAFLGGGVNLMRSRQGGVPGFCPWNLLDPELPTNILIPQIGNIMDCIYRWRVGRWQSMTSDAGQIPDEAHSGIAFFRGQRVRNFSIYGFPTWWFFGSDNTRPGFIQGRHVVLFQNGETTSVNLGPQWTDNFGLGGYTYAGGLSFVSRAAAATLPMFQTLCQGHGPLRMNYEDPRASSHQKSQLQYVWWVIFLVILFVICLIIFLALAFCQEREDMDEPPEDAPEWAAKETDERLVSKRYVSQRSFRVDERDSYSSRSRQSDSGDKE